MREIETEEVTDSDLGYSCTDLAIVIPEVDMCRFGIPRGNYRLGEYLRLIMFSRNVTIQHMCTDTDIHRSVIYVIFERDDILISRIRTICAYLNIDYTELLAEYETNKSLYSPK